MIDNLIFSLNATIPIFLMMVLGYILKKIKWVDSNSTAVMNKLVFRVFLPALLFMDLSKQNFIAMWDTTFVLFCALATVISIIICYFLSLIGAPEDRGEFIQASFRSAAATLGIAFMTNIYDNVAMVALMIIGSVPIYNIVAVIVLCVFAPDNSKINSKKELYKKTLKNVITNPIILGIVAGLIWSLLKLPSPAIFSKSIIYLGNVASPLALITLGASFEFTDLQKNIKPIIAIILALLFRFFIGTPTIVKQVSMYPTLEQNQTKKSLLLL